MGIPLRSALYFNIVKNLDSALSDNAFASFRFFGRSFSSHTKLHRPNLSHAFSMRDKMRIENKADARRIWAQRVQTPALQGFMPISRKI